MEKGITDPESPVLRLDANSTEFDPESKHPVVSVFVKFQLQLNLS